MGFAVKPWPRHLQVLEQFRLGGWEGVVVFLVAILGMGGVEADRQAERGVGIGGLEKLDGLVTGEVGEVASAAIGERLEVRAAVEGGEAVKHLIDGRSSSLDRKPDLADESGSVSIVA